MTKKTADTKKRNFCKHCNKVVIGSSYKFKSHLFKHNAVKARFKCEFCSKEYFRYDIYSRHVKSHSGQQNKKQFVCDYCERGFLNKYNLIAHLKNVHDDPIKSKVKFPCQPCGISFCEKRILDKHIRKLHFNTELNSEPSHFSKLVNEKWVEKAVHADACVEMTKLNNNVITIKKCNKVENMTEIKAEIKTEKYVYGNQFTDQYSKAICDYCKKEMIKKSLKCHIRERHLNVRNYACSNCSKTFKRHYQIFDHKCGSKRKQRAKKL